MNDKYELWTKWPEKEWQLFKTNNDIELLLFVAKRLIKTLGVDCKVYAVERFEQPL